MQSASCFLFEFYLFYPFVVFFLLSFLKRYWAARTNEAPTHNPIIVYLFKNSWLKRECEILFDIVFIVFFIYIIKIANQLYIIINFGDFFVPPQVNY